MVNEINASQAGMVDSIKNFIEPENIAHTIGVQKNTLVEVGLYSAIGFLTGFLIKKYSEYFIAFVFLVVALVILQQFDYIAISLNNAKIHDFFGIQHSPLMGDKYATLLLEWMKANSIGAASFIISFLIGLKVG